MLVDAWWTLLPYLNKNANANWLIAASYILLTELWRDPIIWNKEQKEHSIIQVFGKIDYVR